ncbi:hypothetical protein D0S45_18885 [Marinifilum sp. JC120]|nr:hypothetical protein D0S45_18885 [Marinifilum sp. JC120]
MTTTGDRIHKSLKQAISITKGEMDKSKYKENIPEEAEKENKKSGKPHPKIRLPALKFPLNKI